MKSMKFLSLILFLLIIACGKSNTERNLEKKQKELDTREEQLQSREQQVVLKELELNKLQQQMDSITSSADTIGIFNPAVTGTWQVTMNCIETTCEGSAVGDTKTEQWTISYQDNKVIAQALANKKIIRTYTGVFKENSLQLSAPEGTEQETHMNVVLTPHATAKGLMEGQRIIVRTGICRTVYTLKAEKR